MIQASDGGRVYVGRSALETKLRETPIVRGYGSPAPRPPANAGTATERMSRPVLVASPVEREEMERGIVLAKTTLIGLCLTAFACGIVATVALDRHHVRALEREVRAQAKATAAAVPAAAPPAAPVVTATPPNRLAAAPAPEPEVVQLPAAEVTTPAATSVPPPAAPARVAAARNPRPVARASVRRRPAATGAAPAAAADSADDRSAPAWVDPFAE